MRAERDAVREEATEATATAEKRLREIADQQVLDAIAAQAAATTAAAADRKTAEQAVQDELAAEQEQARLEGETTQLHGRAERAEAQAAADRARVEAVDRVNAELAATVEQLTAHLADAARGPRPNAAARTGPMPPSRLCASRPPRRSRTSWPRHLTSMPSLGATVHGFWTDHQAGLRGPERGMEAYGPRNAQERTWRVVDAVRELADARGV